MPRGAPLLRLIFAMSQLCVHTKNWSRLKFATPVDGTPARAVVERARFMGNESLVEFRVDHDGSMMKGTVPNVFLPKNGTVMWLTVRRDRCFLFQADGTE